MNYQDYSVFMPVTELYRGLPEIQVNLYRVTFKKKKKKKPEKKIS
jgi:hypothetical protein